MFTRSSKLLIFAILTVILTACGSMGTILTSPRDEFVRNYPLIKSIAIEEAANNGFSKLTSEIKPSEFNNWQGQLFFSLVTPYGTDQLFVEFKRKGDSVSIWIYGAGSRSNPDSAAKAISARLIKEVH